MTVTEEELDRYAAHLAPKIATIADEADAEFIADSSNIARFYRRRLALPLCEVCGARSGNPCDTACEGRKDSGLRTATGYVVSNSDVVEAARWLTKS